MAHLSLTSAIQPAKKEEAEDDGADDVKYGVDAHEEDDTKEVEDDDEGENDDDDEEEEDEEEEAMVCLLAARSPCESPID